MNHLKLAQFIFRTKTLMHVIFALLVLATSRLHIKYTYVIRREMCEYLKCSSAFALL
jgi:hypothetical protein